eukprot:gnl/Chilomastix_cuspidata/1.p8 GENE.gnl/Chilomastix_cuspidata/1~~gnl/Chilomastix_cuspidata/1.p8  ORF type:complete len:146 (-),score=16.26 gnl/Chilomastix_cuspidata/1:4379-4816(-)
MKSAANCDIVMRYATQRESSNPLTSLAPAARSGVLGRIAASASLIPSPRPSLGRARGRGGRHARRAFPSNPPRRALSRRRTVPPNPHTTPGPAGPHTAHHALRPAAARARTPLDSDVDSLCARAARAAASEPVRVCARRRAPHAT